LVLEELPLFFTDELEEELPPLPPCPPCEIEVEGAYTDELPPVAFEVLLEVGENVLTGASLNAPVLMVPMLGSLVLVLVLLLVVVVDAGAVVPLQLLP
jgi:uncharacterized protein (DUF983 family)